MTHSRQSIFLVLIALLYLPSHAIAVCSNCSYIR